MLLFKCFCFVYINECIDVNRALKKSFKSMNCLGRKHQFPINFLRWQAPGCISVYSLKSTFVVPFKKTNNLSPIAMRQRAQKIIVADVPVRTNQIINECKHGGGGGGGGGGLVAPLQLAFPYVHNQPGACIIKLVTAVIYGFP